MIAVLKAVFHARRSGLLRLRPADRPMRLECIGGKCGLCCATMGGGIVVDGGFEARIPDHLLSRGPTGSVTRSCGTACAALAHKSCTIYEHRPSGCREYPWYNVDNVLFYDSGCPGMIFDRDERPSASEISPVKRYLILHKAIRYLLVKLMTIW